MRARRLASAVVAAALAVSGLSACRSEPEVAAYIGDERITEKRVQQIWQDAKDSAVDPAEQAAEAPPAPVSRADVLRTLVAHEVLSRIAEDRGVTLPAELAYDRIGAQYGLPGSNEFVRLTTQAGGLQYLLQEQRPNPPALTEEQLRDVHSRLVANGGIEPGTDFEAFRGQLPPQIEQQLRAVVAMRGEIEKAAEPLNITVNPRYQPLELGMWGVPRQSGGQYQIVVAPIGGDNPAPVTDVS